MIPPPGNIGKYLETFLVVIMGVNVLVLASSRPEMLLNTLQCQDSPHDKNFLSLNVNGADLLRNLDLK